MYSNPATKPLLRILLPPVLGCMAYLLVLLAFDTIHRVLDDFFNQELLVCIAMSYLVLEGNRLLALVFRKRLQQEYHFLLWSFFVLIQALVLTLLLTSGALILYFRQLENLYNIASFATELRVFNGIFLFIALLYQAYFLGFSWLHLQFQRKVAAEEHENRLLDHQIHCFHYVLHPDFLLSGLENILLRLKEQQSELADDGILLLSGIYQYFLGQQEELLPLKEELQIVEKLDDFLCRFSPYYIRLQTSVQDQSRLIVPATLVRLIESVAGSQLSSLDAPLLISIEQSADQLVVTFLSNFSLTRQEKLYKMLQRIRQQHNWLAGNEFYWEEQEYFKIFIPTLEIKTHEPTTADV